jgi:hypothetical protein
MNFILSSTATITPPKSLVMKEVHDEDRREDEEELCADDIV